ncbi:hypothetical protein G7K_2674-t1 [Saitoella complicata NRRL Y-17804]|uniref:Transcription factor 25 n=2 Tax=Saitoella complicata (strain BCRC 22490 / CBS 7301 / JCM 7358 / NBRC 10748 / NRRL Y-17804) TaxID=698492 RepID=A0A0E9NFP0_SAICN|nr:hypothetical protein G7K_2674-t1 [Saitoella complicata NRRL Y-17804]
MSLRAIRKAQKAKDFALLVEDEPVGSGSEEEEEEDTPAPKAQNLFAMLNEGDDDDDDDDEDATEVLPATTMVKENLIAEPSPKPSKKKNKKKKKSKGKAAAVPSSPPADDEDDIDAALRAINQKYGSDASTPQRTQTSTPILGSSSHDLWSVDSKSLDAEAEMKRMFGSKVVNSDRPEAGPARPRIRGQLPRGLAKALSASAGKKGILIQPKENWPGVIKGGLGMEIVERHDDGVMEFKFSHSRTYQDVQRQFYMCVNSYDPNNLVNLLHLNPFHVDTLLQVSEILKHQGDHAQAGEMIERALWTFDRALHSLFNIANGTARLPFKFVENRAFYLAAHRHIAILMRRGTYRAAFEFQKLVLSLSPDNDPYGMGLAIDFAAGRTKQWQWFFQYVEYEMAAGRAKGRPNLAYTGALARWSLANAQKKSHEASEKELKQAIKDYPWVVPQLLHAVSARVPWDVAPPTRLHTLLSDLYVHRSKDLWASDEAKAFLSNAVSSFSTAPSVVTEAIGEHDDEIPENVSRHVLLLDIPQLTTHLPSSITQNPGLSSDPLPPANSLPSPYEADMRVAPSQSTESSPQGLMSLLMSLLPGGATDQQRQEVEDALNEGVEEGAAGAELFGRTLERLRGMFLGDDRGAAEGEGLGFAALDDEIDDEEFSDFEEDEEAELADEDATQQ